jgi:hypothetical protein
MNKESIFLTNVRNQTILSDEDNIRFFFFGCWNQNRLATADIINKINEESLCTFGVVCGDNVYPEKINDVKIAKIDDIINGFDILKSFRGDVYIGLGNHEVDTTEPCKSLFDEKQQATSNIIMPNNYYSIDVNNKTTGKLMTKIIIIDTNVLEGNTCYGDYNIDMENEMIEWLKTELSLCGDTTPIVMGHYPLFYFKHNKETHHYEFQKNYTMKKIYEELLGYIKPIYYLCADVHNYQYIITENITQHIVGTGGAQHDKVIEVAIPFVLREGETEEDKKIYNVIKCSQKYGYLHIDIENDIVTGEFKESLLPVDVKELKVKKDKKSKIV